MGPTPTPPQNTQVGVCVPASLPITWKDQLPPCPLLVTLSGPVTGISTKTYLHINLVTATLISSDSHLQSELKDQEKVLTNTFQSHQAEIL